MSGRKLQEELHIPKIPKDEPESFSLEDILREFGAPEKTVQEVQKEQPPAPAPEPSRAASDVATAQPVTPPPQSGEGKSKAASRERADPDRVIQQRLDLVQRGFSGRRVRLVLSFLLSVLAGLLAVSQRWIIPVEAGNSGLLSLGELSLLILCALLSVDVFFSGKDGFWGLGAGYRLLMFYELALAVVGGFLRMAEGESVLCAPVCFALSFALLGVQHRCRGLRDTLEAAKCCTDGGTLFWEPDYLDKNPGILSGKLSKAGLLRGNASMPPFQRIISVYSLLVMAASVAAALWISHNHFVELLSYALLAALMGTPLCSLLLWSRPWSILAARLSQKGAALCGWQGVQRASGAVAVPISDEDLFSSDNMKLNGMKFFRGADPDRVIAYGASVMEIAGGGLWELFARQVELRGLKCYPVVDLRRYETGGVSGEIGRDSVLVGSLRFLQSMGVKLPGGTKVSQAVYVAINSELVGVFAINYGISRSVAEAMSGLNASGRVIPVITAGDFVVTDAFVRTKFRVDTRRFVFPPLSQRAKLQSRRPAQGAVPCVLYRANRFPVAVHTLRGCRALLTASRWGTALALLGGALGLAISLMAIVGGGRFITPTSVMIYQMIWMIPGWIISGWTKNV